MITKLWLLWVRLTDKRSEYQRLVAENQRLAAQQDAIKKRRDVIVERITHLGLTRQM